MPQWSIKDMLKIPSLKEPDFYTLKNEVYENAAVQVDVLRLDQVHPVISGNKLFKLYFFLNRAKEAPHKKIITFGGTHSNHLAATAFACRQLNLDSTGIVRGEEPKILSNTLAFCRENGMRLEFISRSAYQEIKEMEWSAELESRYGAHTLIPEGGFSVLGARGAGLISNFYSDRHYTHVAVPVGTATTMAGIVENSGPGSQVIGFSVLKNLTDMNRRFHELEVDPAKKYQFISDYHFGGYAKKTKELISFINTFYHQHGIPLDFVYTGKMMFALDGLVQKNYFPPGSAVLCLHTGGLQGNDSLPAGTLCF